MFSLSCLLLVVAFLVQRSSPAAILAIVPTLSVSHFAVFEPLLAALLHRGHSLVLVSGYPLDSDVTYEHVDISAAKESYNGSWSLDSFTRIPAPYLSVLSVTHSQVGENENIFRLSSVEALVTSSRTFDLVIVEQFITDVFLGFARKFKAPYITLSPCQPMPWAAARYGSPYNLASSPNLFSGFTSRMHLTQRVTNVLQVVVAQLYHRYILDPASQLIASKHFPSDTPALRELVSNSSLLLVNSHFSYLSSGPTTPQVVEVGGIHVKEPNPLLKELDQWMNESVHGVVYFSFGSMLRGATLPADKVTAFLQVFSTLPQRVLWKWEDDTVDNLPPNVKIMKWIPQRDVLAHPKVKVFISHGGLLGTTEAVVSAVPILGIPMYGDQPNNVAALVERGVAVHVDYNNISVESLSYALNALINDKSFSENAKQLSRRFLDRPQSPLETAVYWTEYVIRHKGAPHLRSAAVHLSWYQYYLLDVLAVLLAGLTALLAVLYLVVRTCFRAVCAKNTTKLKTN